MQTDSAVRRPHLRQTTPVWLLAFTLAAFATGTDDMVIAGLLPYLSADLQVSEPVVGQLVTVYALVYGLGAPVCAVMTGRLPRRRLLIIATTLFALVNVVMSLAPAFAALLALRVLAALLAATIVPTALALVAASAPADRRGRWLSTVTAGITLSLIAGVPLGTWIAGWGGWRSTMIMVAILAGVAAIGMGRVPDSRTAERATIKAKLRPLTRPAVLMVSVSMVIAGSGGMMGYIYLAPLFRHLTGGGPTMLGLLILIFGSAGFAGVLLGGRGADAIGPARTLTIGFGTAIAMIMTLAALANVLPAGSVPFPVLAALTALWGAGLWSFSPPMQAWLLPRAQGVESAVLALNTSGMYLGFAIGGAIGGFVLAAWGAAAVPVASAVLLSLGGMALAASITLEHRREGKTHADR